MSDLRDSLKALSERDREFVLVYIAVAKSHPRPHDGIVAARIGCTDRSVRRRRKRLQALGVPLPRLATPGYQGPDHCRPRTLQEERRRIARMRRKAAELLRLVDEREAEIGIEPAGADVGT